MTIYKFKLLRGSHGLGGYSTLKEGRNRRTHGTVYHKGDTFETEVDLLKKFGPSSKAKFELLSTREPESESCEEPEPEAVENDGLEDMSLKELRAYAREEGLDLEGARSKKDAVRALREGLEQVS